MVPALILLIFLLPYAASVMVNSWSNSSETIALQDATTHITSSIQQLYFFLDSPSLSSATVTNSVGIPTYINGYAYSGKATLTSTSGSSSEKVLNLTLTFIGNTISTSSIVTLGGNVQLTSSSITFTSTAPNTCISAYKDSSNTIWLSFTT